MESKKFIATTIREYLNKQQILNEKTLYHGTTIHNLTSIKQNGLIPTIGNFVKNMYVGSVEGDVMDYLDEILYATDKKQFDKARTAIIYQIANKLRKDYHSVTNEEFEKYGALAVVKNGDEYFDFNTDEDQYYGRTPLGVETGDYYTRNKISPDYILTGKKLTSFFKKFGLYPIKQNMNENKNTMVDTNLKAFQVLAWKQEQLIAKVLYDNGVKTEQDYVNWLKTTNSKLPQVVINNVRNSIRDFEINFINPNNVPNIFKLRG